MSHRRAFLKLLGLSGAYAAVSNVGLSRALAAEAEQTPIQMLVPASVNPMGYSQFSGLPHQHLLVSTAQAMGLSIDQVGIEHVQGQRGDRVECTGPLPDLT